MPQQSHHKGSEREQGNRETGAEREGKGREGKQSGAGGAGEEQRQWAREKKKQTKHQCNAHADTEVSKERRIHDAPDSSIRGGVELGPGHRTGSSSGEPGATDWSV